MRRGLRARLLDIEERETAAKRGGDATALSLDKLLDSSNATDDENRTLPDVLADSDPETSPEANAERRILRERLDQAIRRLPPDQRAVARRLRKGWTVSEVSQALGIPRTTVYGALQRLRESFRDKGLEEFLR